MRDCERGMRVMYHILLFITVVLTVVIIWAVKDYDVRAGQFTEGMYAFVAAFFLVWLVWLAKRVLNKPDERENKVTQTGISDEEGAIISSGNDLYLISHRGDDTISYRIENEKETILELVGNITLGRLDSIELFHGAPVPGEAFQVIRKNGVKEYTVREGETVVGTIKERKEGLDYRDADGRLIYTADFSTGSVCEEEESVADIVAVVTLTPRLGRAKKDILLIKGPEGEIAGKYYYALRNLELALDGSRAADRHIAAVLAIMADTKLQLAK